MISYLLTVSNVIGENIGMVAAVIEGISVTIFCIVRIVKLIVDIVKAFKDNDPDNRKQVGDIVDEAVKDLKGTIKGDTDKDDKDRQ